MNHGRQVSPSTGLPLGRVLIVHRKSLYQLYVTEHSEPAVKRAIRRRDPAALALRKSHQDNLAALKRVEQLLRARGVEVVSRWRGQMRAMRDYDLIISLGGDGTLLDTSHRVLDDTPLIGVNSDPTRSVGALCCTDVRGLPRVLDALASGSLRPIRATRMSITVDGQQVLGPTLNDVLVAHVCPAGLSRLDCALVPASRALAALPGKRGLSFRHLRGSGLWVSTALGSTAAIRSAGGKPMPARSRRLQYLVREPFVPPDAPRPDGLAGFVPADQAMVLISRLRRGRLWADGVHRSVALSYGQQIVLQPHPVPLRLVRCR